MSKPPLVRLPIGPDHYWAVMRELTASVGAFTITDVYKRTNGVTRRAIWAYVENCEREGHVKRTGAKDDRSAVFKLVSTLREAPIVPNAGEKGRKGRIAENLWQAMRKLQTFRLAELAFAASTDELPVKVNTATRYVRVLRKAGLVEIAIDGGQRKATVYRLNRRANTGPRAPQVYDARVVYDPNTRAIAGEIELTKEAAA
ncbi:MAG TPA: hypothetical protein P5256_18365 [Beijerinckiaceae bacterium]|nr:hypothetical protein [Beijerinckiaceae bacterium]